MFSLCIPSGPTIHSPTDRGRFIVKILKIVIVLSIIMAVISFVMTGNFFGIIFAVISILILYRAVKKLDFCALIIYIFLSVNRVVEAFIGVGTIFQ